MPDDPVTCNLSLRFGRRPSDAQEIEPDAFGVPLSLSVADRAKYEAKRHGKGGFVIHAHSVEIVSLAPSVEGPKWICRRVLSATTRSGISGKLQ